MPTIGEAAKLLDIGRVTLEKWMKFCEITPVKHTHDMRFHIITDEDVQRLRDELAKRPGRSARTSASPSPSRTPRGEREADGAAARNDLEVDTPSLPSSRAPRVPASRPHRSRLTQPLHRSERRGRGEATGDLPDGMMSITEAERLHGIPASNIRHWSNTGIIETDPGTYLGEHGRFEINRPLTRRGLAQLYAKMIEWERARIGRTFTRCPDCPHDLSDLDHDDQDAAE